MRIACLLFLHLHWKSPRSKKDLKSNQNVLKSNLLAHAHCQQLVANNMHELTGLDFNFLGILEF